jgi:hypothetical protein
MKTKISLLTVLTCLTFTTFSQDYSPKYTELVKKADSLYQIKEYKASAFTYSEAFKANGWVAKPVSRYNAACSWSMANYADSAFFHLNRLATNGNYKNYGHITTDTDLLPIHEDSRWKPLLEAVKQNKEKAEANLDKPLVAILDSIHIEDQKYRQQIDGIEKKYGWDSKEMKAHWKVINTKDSANLIKVQNILDTKGWLGADAIGQQGNQTLFLVIQHSKQKVQEKYLPMMREAVKNGKASGSSLALLEDRVALGQGKKQIYGSQIGRNNTTNKPYILSLEDPDNVDKRRANVGLDPLAEYVNHWQIKWDVEQYKKDNPVVEKK